MSFVIPYVCGVLLFQHISIIFRAQYGALLVQKWKNLNVSAFSSEYILTLILPRFRMGTR